MRHLALEAGILLLATLVRLWGAGAQSSEEAMSPHVSGTSRSPPAGQTSAIEVVKSLKSTPTVLGDPAVIPR